ncbi:hypothetical protein SLS55_006042 [Diplodia seriata]|uniref:DUF7730 domain-containing protein n=1 Tax=Diplodia seriata TaxID=420778 RepID=A0ABR3CD21_9PEZI
MASFPPSPPPVEKGPFRFMDLPKNVRLQIYDLILGSREVIIDTNYRSTVTDCILAAATPKDPHWLLTQSNINPGVIIGLFLGQAQTALTLFSQCWLCAAFPSHCLSRSRRLQPQTLLVSRAVHAEAAAVLYRSTTFLFHRHEVFAAFLARTAPPDLARVRHITLLAWRRGFAPADDNWTAGAVDLAALRPLAGLQHLRVVVLGRRVLPDGFALPARAGAFEIVDDGSGDDSDAVSMIVNVGDEGEGEDGDMGPPKMLVRSVARKRLAPQEAAVVLGGLEEEVLLLVRRLTDLALERPDTRFGLDVDFKAATSEPFGLFDLEWPVDLGVENADAIQAALRMLRG